MKHEKSFVVDVLFVLALFGVFSISSLLLVTIGAGVYKKTVSDMGKNYDSRTAIAYITEKVRQSDLLLPDETPAVAIGTLEKEPALMLREELDGVRYCTYLYLYNGYLKELYVREDSYVSDNMLPAGQDILALDFLAYTQPADNLLTVSMITSDGKYRQINLSLHCN